MVKVLQNRLETEDHTEWVLIEPIEFAWEVESVGRGFTDPKSSAYLSRLARQVQDGVTAIWFPLNVYGSHWIAGKVDFEERTFAFGELRFSVTRNQGSLLVVGDSMATPGTARPPAEALKGLRRWFQEQFGWKLLDVGNTLERPFQPDSYSCAICAMNTISHGIFNDPLWTSREASVHRIRWLLKLNEHEGLAVTKEPVS